MCIILNAESDVECDEIREY